MDDRTLLHIVLTLVVFNIALNAYTLTEMRQLGSRAAAESIGPPPANPYFDIMQGSITFLSECHRDCIDAQLACLTPCTEHFSTEYLDLKSYSMCVNNCNQEYLTCRDPCDKNCGRESHDDTCGEYGGWEKDNDPYPRLITIQRECKSRCRKECGENITDWDSSNDPFGRLDECLDRCGKECPSIVFTVP